MASTSVKRSYADLFRKRKDLDAVIEDVNALHLRLEKFTLNLDKFREQLSDLKLDISKSKKEEMEKETLEQWKLRKTINVVGIPYEKDENTRELIMTICRFVGFENNDDVFASVSRMKGDRQKPSRPVLVCVFRRMGGKRVFMECVRAKRRDMTFGKIFNVNEGDWRVYVDEAMTAKNKRLLKDAKRFQREGILRYVWFKNGRVLYREHGLEPTYGVVTDRTLQSWSLISDFFREQL